MSGCGTGSCGCSSTESSQASAPASTLTPTQAAAYEALAASMVDAPVQSAPSSAPSAGAAPVARVNGVPLNTPSEWLDEETLRQRACTELLRQAAQQAGLLSADDAPGVEGATSAEASNAIEQLLDRELNIPEPSLEACRRYHEAHPAAHAQGERAHLRHVLFAVTPGVDVKQLRLRAEALLIELRCADDAPGVEGATSAEASNAIEQLLDRELNIPEPSLEACRRYHEAHPAAHAQGERAHLRHVLFAVTPGVDVKQLRLRAEALLIELRCADDGGAKFAQAAAQWSNCPSGQQGGDLGWLTRADCAPEFAREVFGGAEVGVLARLVHSRFGLHVVEVVARDPGQQPSFEEVRQAIALTLRQQAWVNALRQYLQLLAGAATVEGVMLDAADTPLVQ